MHWLHQCVCMWEKESVGMRAASALSDETLPTFKGYFKLFPLIKFSITWVNRGRWEKNKYPHLSQRTQPSPLPANTHMHPQADTRCQPIWLPVRKSHPPRQVPFSPRTIFPAMSDMGILMNAQWQYLGSRAAILPLQIYCGPLLYDKKKETTETNRCGSETHLLSQIKNSSFKAAQRYWAWFLGLSMQMEVWLGTLGGGGGAGGEEEEENGISSCSITSGRLDRKRGGKCCFCLWNTH